MADALYIHLYSVFPSLFIFSCALNFVSVTWVLKKRKRAEYLRPDRRTRVKVIDAIP